VQTGSQRSNGVEIGATGSGNQEVENRRRIFRIQDAFVTSATNGRASRRTSGTSAAQHVLAME